MRGTVAKFLRREALKATIGQPERVLVYSSRVSRQRVNRPGTTRYLYRYWKKRWGKK